MENGGPNYLDSRVATLEARLDHLATKEDVKDVLIEVRSKMIWMIVMFLLSVISAIGSALLGWLT